MKQRLADYIADFLVTHGVTVVFDVVGGDAMPDGPVSCEIFTDPE